MELQQIMRRCKQFKKPFVDTSDKFATKTFGVWEVTETSGAKKKYTVKIYRQYFRKCLYDWNSEFWFGPVNVSERTKEKTNAAWKAELK